jgi:alpha-D-ribose 1-methylphosphonate 5-triphosphate synthase subunit PhnG
MAPCPHCGLTGRARQDIFSIEASMNGPALTAQAIAQRIQLDVAERNLRACQLALVMIRDHIAEMGEVVQAPEG